MKQKWARSDVWIEAERERQATARAKSESERVRGLRVVITADIDYGREGTILGKIDGLFQVQLDGDEDVLLMSRDELARAS